MPIEKDPALVGKLRDLLPAGSEGLPVDRETIRPAQAVIGTAFIGQGAGPGAAGRQGGRQPDGYGRKQRKINRSAHLSSPPSLAVDDRVPCQSVCGRWRA